MQILGIDLLIDSDYDIWLMEANSNPSLNMFVEHDLPNGDVHR